MALYAQSKAKRGAKITPQQFNPYMQNTAEEITKDTPKKLLDKFKNF